MTPLTLLFRQDRLQHGYITLAQTLPWLHGKLSNLDIDECEDMIKKVCALHHLTLPHVHKVIAQERSRCGTW
jgi:hypothetical protein